MRLQATVLALAVTGVVAVNTINADDADNDEQLQARVDAAGEASGEFLKQLGGTMMKEMQAGGPVAAMKVCREVAPQIANDKSLEKGWKMTRVGTRVRNPMLGMPDAWEQEVLKDFQARAGQGEKFDQMTSYEVVDEPSGTYLRYMKAIGVAPQCLACHGSPDQIAGPVKAEIERLYPHDRALGYKPGDLRGAVSIKQPLE